MPPGSEPFDPQAPEGDESRGNQYLSRKDLRNVLIVIAVLGVVLFPVYQQLRRQGERTFCSQNMRSISQAILLYLEQNDDRFPPAYRPDVNGAPVAFDGHPITWATLVEDAMSRRQNFRCPSAAPDEVTRVASQSQGKVIELTYGLYAGVATRTVRDFDRPDMAVMLSETSNFGAQDTYNPLPWSSPSGEPIRNDGFLIGWNETNLTGMELRQWINELRLDEEREAGDPNKLGLKPPVAVTRLAFPGSSGAKFRDEGRSRHDTGIHAITVAGQLVFLRPPAARIQFDGVRVTGRWAVP